MFDMVKHTHTGRRCVSAWIATVQGLHALNKDVSAARLCMNKSHTRSGE